MDDDEENIPVLASSVWLLMGKGYRISRSIRLQWFFQHLNSMVSPKPSSEIIDSEEELEILAVLENEVNAYNSDAINTTNDPDSTKSLLIVPTTRLSFVDRQYRFVYCIDMSPSMATVDSKTGEALVDDMFVSIKNSLIGLVQPFCIGDSDLELSPRLYITVIAHTYTDEKECQVLMQGFCLNSKNVQDFLCKLRRKLRELCERLIHGIVTKKVDKKTNGFQKNQTTLFHMIRDSLLALFLLPNNASAAIVVVTDGVFILENAYVTDALLNQVRNSTAVVSFLQVGTGYQRASVELGYVPHCALMQFIATATSGAYLLHCPPVNTSEVSKMNIYHHSLLCWNFQRDVDRNKVMVRPEDLSDYLFHRDGYSTTSDQRNEHFHMPLQPLNTARHTTTCLPIKISSLLSMKAREGYITDSIRFHRYQDVFKIEVKLVWPWKENVTIEYIAKANWPLDSESNKTDIIVNIAGPYEFLHDIINDKPKAKPKPLRKTVLQRFAHTMKSLEQSDNLLVQLHSFPYTLASKIPETIAKGSSLFCMTSNTSTPVLSLQYGSVKLKKASKSPEVQFANFWKPVVSMDTKVWSKWFHCHRISILMKHDRPLTKDLFTPSASGQYPSVPCRAAINAFNKLLKEWCDFTLLENHTYVKFMSRSEKEAPYSFCVLRLTPKGLCIIMRLAFLLGTPGIERSKVTEEFRGELARLRVIVDRSILREDYSLNVKSQKGEEPCIIFLNKQFERILIKYDYVTDDVRSSGFVKSLPDSDQQQENTQGSQKTVLGQYLFNQRWIWSMNINSDTCFDSTSISQILNTIMKQRLHEGFNFCSFGKGIISLTKEINITVNSSEENLSNCCTIQYIIFPPHQKLLNKQQEDSTESDGPFQESSDRQMVLEVWVEPQMGTVDIPNTPLSYIHGSEYNKIPQKIFDVDSSIVTEITSYLLLHRTCYDAILKENMPDRGTPSLVIPTDTFQPSSVVQVPLLFEVVPLIKKSSLIVSTYPMLICSKLDEHKENDILLNYLITTLEHMNDMSLTLNPSENSDILDHILTRCQESDALREHSKTQFNPNQREDNVNFICFLKSFGSSLVIMLLPASVKDLNILIGESEERDSVDSLCRMNIPFFIFECCFTSLQTVPLATPDFNLDVIQDYTEALNESALIPRHLNQKLPDTKSRQINMYCQAVYDHFFWAMVSAVYECLKSSLPLDPEDVEFAIELFCEESIKEIDITMFMRTLCSHYRSNTLIVDQLSVDDVIFPDYLSTSQPENKPLSRIQKRSSSGSSSFKSSRTSLRMKNGECENASLANEIKKLFMHILEQYFHQVPGNPYYSFFNDGQTERLVGSNKSSELENENDIDSQDASSAHSSTTGFSHNANEYLNVSDNFSSGPDSDNVLEDDGDDFESNGLEMSNDERPMFLHLTCSIHYKTTEETFLRPIPVSSLPTCLGDIFNQIYDSVSSIDPYGCTVTLDLICLSQPSEPIEDNEWKTPKDIFINQDDSNDSFYSNHSESSSMNASESRPRLLSHVSREESYIRQPSDAIEHIPAKQRNAIEKTLKDIKWLLEDEITSALRHQVPITEENLDRVASHIRMSLDKENCTFLKKYFNFVTGLDKVSNHNLPMFIVELESTNLDHRLKRVGKYYSMIANSLLDEESDFEPGILDQVKEKAKITRKGLGHRRSHSDFTTQRHKVIVNKVKLREKKKPRKRSNSWPSFLDKANADTNFVYGIENQQTMPTQHFPTKAFWDVDDDDSEFSNHSVSSKGNLSTSHYPYESRDLLQRSMSYSEYQKKERSAEPRKHRSLPNICKPLVTETDGNTHDDTDNDLESDDDDADDVAKKSVSMKVKESAGGVDIESIVNDEDQLSQPHPQFWLFLQITEEYVSVYFHHRQTESKKSIEILKSSYTKLLDTMDQICKIVNQSTLLQHLHETFTVHNLLIAEDEEKIWSEEVENNNSPKDMVFIKSRESTSTPFHTVIHGEYQFKPGYFECDMVWQYKIPIHNRLLSLTTGGQSIALNRVRSVLGQFQAQNRQNVFVIKEKNNNVVYVRLNQVSNTTGRTSPPLEDDTVFRPVHDDPSRASSVNSLFVNTTSLSVNREDGTVERLELERQDSYHSFQYMPSRYEDKSSTSESCQQSQPQDYITFSVFGIREPGQEIKDQVINMITKKLDYDTLDLINLYISRNPKCKLTPKDVEFIQPPGKLPSKKIQLCVTEFGLKYLHAIMFYFHQHLLKKYNTPRYAFTDSAFHFKNYTGRPRNVAEPITANNTYLYNRRGKSEIGIGIVYVTLVDQEGRNVIAQPCFPTLKFDHETVEQAMETLLKILQVKRYEELTEDQEEYARNFIVEISIWENGDINIEQFEKDLLENFHYALFDVFLEFQVLNTPICDIPQRLQIPSHSRRRESVMHRRSSFNQIRSGAHSSGSSSATTPKFCKPFISQTSAGKRSEPGTPIRSDSPAVASASKDDWSRASELANSFPKDFSGSKECSPTESSGFNVLESNTFKRTPSSESYKRESPNSVLSEKRESPAMRREGSFTKKDTSPILQRKLSARDTDQSPLQRKRSASSRTSSVRSESELTSSIDSPMETSGNSSQLQSKKYFTVKDLNQMKALNAASFDLVSGAELREAFENDGDDKKTTWQEVEIKRRLDLEKLKERRSHEHGLVGDLHPTYHSNVVDIFEKVLETGNICLHKQEGSLHHHYPMELVMIEFTKDIKEKSPDTKPKVFKGINRIVDGSPYHTFTVYGERAGVKTKEEGETSMDFSKQQPPVSLIPGQSPEYIVIGHNAHQWLSSIGADEDELSDDEERMWAIDFQGKQLFKPLHNPYNLSINERKNIDAEFPSCISPEFIPRQKFFIAIFKNKKVTLYTYNFTSEVTTALDKQLKRLYAWHNVRTHLSACLFIQKLGLFHHKHFVRDCPDKEDSDVASFASSSNRNHLIPLMKEVSPKAKERNRNDSYNPPSGVPIPEFDGTFRDIIPTKPLHRCRYFSFKDLVKRQAWQFQDVRNIKLQIAYQESRLREIFNAWKQEGAHVPITEDKLHLLQHRSRFIHYCDAPVLFKEYEQVDVCSVKNILKTTEGMDKPPVSDVNRQQKNAETGHVPGSPSDKSDWFEELKWALIQQYIQYLQTLGVCLVQIVNKKNTTSKANRTNARSASKNRSTDVKEFSKPDSKSAIFHLQKTTNGGIILMDIFFKRKNLCYKMSAFQIGKLNEMSSYVNERDNRQFFADINRYKDLTHLRSFTYDFHIREIQNHLSGRHSRFQKTYPVHLLMSLIMKEYPTPPRFCRCILAEGFVSVPCSADLTPSTVFDYFVLNSTIYDMVRVPVSKDSTEAITDDILTYSYSTEKEPIQFPESWRTRRDKTEYDGNVAIHFIPSDNIDVINLPFFIAMGNKKEFYPRPHMFSNVSSLKRRQRVASSMDFTMDGMETTKQKTRVRFSGPNDSQESNMYIHEVQSTGTIRRMPSWNANLAEAVNQSVTTSSIRSSESDSSLSAKMFISPKVSPGKISSITIFKMSDQHLSGGSPDSDTSSDVMVKFQHPLNSTQENYIQNEVKFVNNEILRVRSILNNKVGRCLSHCWRDLLWHNLLVADMTCDDDKRSRNKKISDSDVILENNISEWKKLHLIEELKDDMNGKDIGVTYSTMKLLIGLVENFPMESIEKRIYEAFTYVQPNTQQAVIRNLIAKYGNYCRKFVSDDGDSTYLCILNENDLDMFYLVNASESQGMMDFSVIYRTKPSATPLECKSEEMLTVVEKHARRHIENVNTCLCFNLWMQLLPN